MGQNSKNFKGYLIAFEGVDGSGKTTLINKLSQYLKVNRFKVYLSKEPGDNPIGKAHRELSLLKDVHPYTAALISTADRYLKMDMLLDNINQGYLVLSDRYYLSGLAYHRADGISFEEYAYLNKNALKPDLYIFLEVSLENAQKRLEKARDKWETMLERVHTCYYDALEFLKENENARIQKLNANRPFDRVFEDGLNLVQTFTLDGCK